MANFQASMNKPVNATQAANAASVATCDSYQRLFRYSLAHTCPAAHLFCLYPQLLLNFPQLTETKGFVSSQTSHTATPRTVCQCHGKSTGMGGAGTIKAIPGIQNSVMRWSCLYKQKCISVMSGRGSDWGIPKPPGSRNSRTLILTSNCVTVHTEWGTQMCHCVSVCCWADLAVVFSKFSKYPMPRFEMGDRNSIPLLLTFCITTD